MAVPTAIHQERGIKLPVLRASLFNVRWGIGARLGIAFAAVAGFAVAANILAEREMSVMYMTRIVPVAVPSSPVLVPAPAAVSATVPRPVVVTPAEKKVSSDRLVSAIEHFEVATRSRLDIHNDLSDRQLAIAVDDLNRESQAYAAQVQAYIDPKRLQQLRTEVAAYHAQGDALVASADKRQDILKEFWSRFEAIDARTKSALNNAWKIFGRVIARRSLLDLNADTDEIRRRFTSLPANASFDNGALDAVAASEAAFDNTLQQGATELTRSQGGEWVTQTSADMAYLMALQSSIIQLDAQRRGALDVLAQQSAELVALAQTKVVLPRPRPQIIQPMPRPQLSPVLTPTLLPETPSLVPNINTPLKTPTLETTSTSQRAEHPALIGWLSAAVLLLLLLVSAWTIGSIVGPVRRMRSATRRLADGEVGVQVARGGIHELDELAISFNQMAGQLAAAQALARTYQEQLEAKVVQRTRELQHLAEHDPLTQLPNRRQLFMHLKTAIEHAHTSGSYVGVFFLDLDNFKNINDSMGHAFGDRVLEAIAEQLRASAGVDGFAARLGGDEFTVVCGGAKDVEQVRKLGMDLVRAFQKPVGIDGRELMIGVSVGASLFPDHGDDPEALLSAADAALFRAKALGRSQLTVFSPELLEAASAKFSTEQGLRRAVERGEFELVFQPEIDASTLQTGSVEALLRWRLPDGRRASPAEFLTIAEESGLIMEISDWVLRSSIENAARWHHGVWPEARVAINLSSRQLLDTRFVDRVADLLREYQLPPRCIEIELTENVLQTGAATIDVLNQLRAHGVAITLDDFGTGYSSLASLEQLPLTRVKLDRALIASVHTSARSAAIARAIIGLCHGIGLDVTAEGIECVEQLLLLTDQAPMYLQGYLLSRPVAADKLPAVLATLPAHMQSLLLMGPGVVLAEDPVPEERTLLNLRAL